MKYANLLKADVAHAKKFRWLCDLPPKRGGMPIHHPQRTLANCRSENVKEQAYLALVRPQLEYADVVHGTRIFKNR